MIRVIITYYMNYTGISLWEKAWA